MNNYLESLEHFDRYGYVILRDAIELPLLDCFWAEVERNLAHNPELTFTKYGQLIKNRDIKGQALGDAGLRIIDIEKHSASLPCIMLHHVVREFLSKYYGQAPTAIQTLTYKFSSQQGAHSDLHLVNPGSIGPTYDRSTLTAAWFAFEDADERNGGLVIYPGSHLIPKKTLWEFSNKYGDYVSYLEDLCAAHGIAPQIFSAKKGDLLLWQGDFVHAGGAILCPQMTRKSLVVHYARLSNDNTPFDSSLTRQCYEGSYYYR